MRQVYMIRAGQTDMIKIGTTSLDPQTRLSQLQTGSFEPLSLMRLIEDNVESLCHRYFAAQHHHREWYHYHKDMETIPAEALRTLHITGRLPPLAEPLRAYYLEAGRRAGRSRTARCIAQQGRYLAAVPP
jgi:hypothetical protein